jgi:2-methylisocitrate lyase-like PEP mutase family enzyme
MSYINIMNQSEKAELFRKLHERPHIFAIPNPWDAGSAKMLSRLGFEALATTSAGFAFSIGKSDGTGSISREEMLENAKVIVNATSLPFSADLENGYGYDP